MLTERSFVAPKIFSDAWIEYWAAVYLEPRANARLRAKHVLFETFLLAPHEILAAAWRPTEGLLPAQREVQRRTDIVIAIAAAEALEEKLIELRHCIRRAGAAFEKLKHRAWPRHRGRKTATKET